MGYYVLPFLNFELQFSIGRLEGADSLIKNKGGFEIARKDRAQHFRSPLKEAYLAAKFYPTTLLFDYDPESLTSRVRPYFIVGIGMFQFNPQGQYIASNYGSGQFGETYSTQSLAPRPPSINVDLQYIVHPPLGACNSRENSTHKSHPSFAID